MEASKKRFSMEITSILTKLGFSVVSTSQHAEQLHIYYFNNPDGTVRWFWPSTSTHPLFLKFYHVSGLKSKVFSILTHIVFGLRLHRLMFRHVTVAVNRSERTARLTPVQSEWAAFTGTPGPNRKAIIYSMDQGKPAFIKIALGDNAPRLLQNEALTLAQLRDKYTVTFTYPEPIHESVNTLTLSAIGEGGMRSDTFSLTHSRALYDLFDRDVELTPSSLEYLTVWKETKTKLQHIIQQKDKRIPKGLLRKLDEIIKTTETAGPIELSLSHGDFTPWNMFVQADGSLAVYDWELSQPKMPVGYDAFHFIIQNGILVKRNSWKQIQHEITDTLFRPGALLENYTPDQRKLYLKLYLVINTIYYLGVYQEQNEWHIQIEWLINTWNDALSSVLATTRSNRELLAMDTIDFLSNKNYAALKYHHELPEKLSEFSDMDFSIDHKYIAQVDAFLSNHVLIKQRKTIRKSFMISEHLILLDGTLLSLDFIWQMKRKQLEMMDNKILLANASVEKSGVRIPHALHDARYVGLFYALNKASVPVKYQHYRGILTQSSEFEDQLLADYYLNNDEQNYELIMMQIKRSLPNQGIKKVINTIHYWIDSLKEIIGTRGMVITFSGVDGAGKSTVIENLRIRIEKQLRKRVVVIRHRPSLLPILSAWTKGKAAAEKDAASKLPRQGTNKNSISSFLRFSYYYVDYLLGQWYIMIKYVLRGYIVLYDRYYFDFINDSKRSNIALPQGIAKLGYALIREPDLNFFLYANADLILTRKKELDKNTIEELTVKYLSLFHGLNKKNCVPRYISIENIDLSVTLQTILGKMSHAVS